MALDFQVQRIDAGLAAIGLCHFQRFAPQAAPAVGLGDQQLVDEGLPAAVFEAEAERHRDIAHDGVSLMGNPKPSERWLAYQHERGGARFGGDEGIAVRLVISAHHRDDGVDVAGLGPAETHHAGWLRGLRFGRSRARCRNQTSATSASAGMYTQCSEGRSLGTLTAATLKPCSKPDFLARLPNFTAETRTSGPSAEMLKPASARRLRPSSGLPSCTATVFLMSSPSRLVPSMTSTRRSSSGSSPATRKISFAGTSVYGAYIRSMKKSGRKSAKVATSRSAASHHVQRVRNHIMVAAAKMHEATVAANATSATSAQPRTSIMSSIGL